MNKQNKHSGNMVYVSRLNYSKYKEFICSDEGMIKYPLFLTGIVNDYYGDPTMCYCKLYDVCDESLELLKQNGNFDWLVELIEMEVSPEPKINIWEQ